MRWQPDAGVKTSSPIRFSIASALVASAIVLAIVILGARQLWNWHAPSDGVEWQVTAHGLRAGRVLALSPAWKAGVRGGDWLIAVNGAPLLDRRQVQQALFAAGAGGTLNYIVLAGERLMRVQLHLSAAPRHLLRYGYEDLIALCFLAIGLYVLLRRSSTAQAQHFFWYCLASSLLFGFHFSGRLDWLDWVLFWGNVAGTLLAPAMLLDFACNFPAPLERLRRMPGWRVGIYIPAALLALFQIAVSRGALSTGVDAQYLADRLAYAYLGICLGLAAGLFWRSYRRAAAPLLRQQLKWLTRGMLLAAIPFLGLYVIPYVAGWPLPPGAEWSLAGLLLIPFAFANAIIRYRLMDTDILFRRGLAFTIAALLVIAADFAAIGLVAALIRTKLPNSGTLGLVFAVVLAALLFEPVKNQVQARLEQWLDPHRGSDRQALTEMARQLSAEHSLDRLTAGVLEQLQRRLRLDRVALFLADQGTLRLAGSRGLTAPAPELNLDFLSAELESRRYLFIENPQQQSGRPEPERRALAGLDLHFYLPCRTRQRLLAVLGLGRTRSGDYLTSEETALLEILAGHLAIALENARLHGQLHNQVRQFERLKEFNENIVESVGVGIVALSPDDRVESWNTQMEVLTARPRAGVLGLRLEEALGAEFAAAYYQARPEGGLRQLEKFHLRLDPGSETGISAPRVVNVAIAPLVTPQLERIGRILLFDDISARVELESQLAQAERLRSLGLLAAGVAHEVNTPLAVISNYTQLLAKQMAAGDPRAPVLDVITRQTFRASEIVSNLLHFARAQGGEKVPVDLHLVLQDTLALVEHPLRSARIQVDLALEPALPEIIGHAGQLQQVLLNLLLNARDAMPGGGRLHLCTRSLENGVEIAISDTGTGMPAEVRERIFDPFFTTKKPARNGNGGLASGTGLGLSVSYGIIQDHQGSISVESTPGRGSCFRIHLPAAERTLHA